MFSHNAVFSGTKMRVTGGLGVSELIETLVYFITLCHGWPCRGCHRERRALGWKIHLNACLTVTRFKWNNIIVLMACLWLYCTVHNGVKFFMESYKVQSPFYLPCKKLIFVRLQISLRSGYNFLHPEKLSPHAKNYELLVFTKMAKNSS